MAPDKHSHVGFVEIAPSHGQYHLGKVILGGVEVKPVQVEKDDCSDSTDAFVAIDEGMVLDQVEQIGCGHLVNVRVQELAAIGSRRHAEGGFEQLDIPDAGGAAVAVNLVLVNFQDLAQAEEDRIHRLFRQLFQGLRVPGVHLVESGLEGFPATGILHRAENEDLAVGGNIERCIGIRTNQLQHRLFDHQCQAVSVFSQGFDQGSDLPFLLTHCYYKDTTNKRPGQGPLAISVGGGRAKSVLGLLPNGRPQGGCRSGLSKYPGA